MNQIFQFCKNDPNFFARWIVMQKTPKILKFDSTKEKFITDGKYWSIQNPIISPDKLRMIYFYNHCVNVINFTNMKSKIILGDLLNVQINNIESFSDVKYGWLSDNEIVIAIKNKINVDFYISKYSNTATLIFSLKIQQLFHFHVQNGVIIIAELDYTKKLTHLKIIEGKRTYEIILNGVQQYLQPHLSPKGDKLGIIYDKKSLPVGLNSLYNLWTLDMKTKKMKQLTKGIKWVMFKWFNNDVIIGLKNYGPFNQLYLFDTNDLKLLQLTDNNFSIQDFDINDGWVVCTGNDVFGQIHTKVFDVKHQPILSTVIKPNKRFQKVIWNGTYNNMQGLLIFPPNYKSSKKYQLIVDIHGGGPGSSIFLTGSILRYCSQEWFFLSELFNCLIFVPEFRSSGVYDESVFSKDFIRGNVDDINSGVDYLIKKQLVDKNKMVVIGGSYGALISNFIPIVTNRYRSIISVEGWIKYDLPIDPLTIPNLSTPIFFIQGNPELGGHEIEDDIKTFHKKLISSGIHSEYLFIKDEGHVFYKRKNIQKIFDHIVSWLNIYLN